MKRLTPYLREANYFFASSLAIFLLLEWAIPGVVIGYMNLNYWLILWLITGIMLIYTRSDS